MAPSPGGCVPCFRTWPKAYLFFVMCHPTTSWPLALSLGSNPHPIPTHPFFISSAGAGMSSAYSRCIAQITNQETVNESTIPGGTGDASSVWELVSWLFTLAENSLSRPGRMTQQFPPSHRWLWQSRLSERSQAYYDTIRSHLSAAPQPWWLR